MTDKMDMSLDEIISATKKTGGGARNGSRGAGGGRRGAMRGAGGARRGAGGPPRSRSRSEGTKRVALKSRSSSEGRNSYARGNPDGQWDHDMYSGGGRGAARGGISTGGPGKLLVSNLDFGVSESDIHELFSEFGNLKLATVHYDRSGRSLGTAEVTFDRKSDAIKALKQYNGVPLDGRPMRIEIAGTERDMAIGGGQPLRRPMSGGVQGRRDTGPRKSPFRGSSGGRGGGGGAGAGAPRKEKEAAPSKEKLDEEMDAYMSSKA